MRRVVTFLTAFTTILLGALTLAPSASAAGYGCSGSQIDSYSVITGSANGSVNYGNVYLYYDSSTGYNCAVTVANSAGGNGVAKEMYISLIKCTQTTSTGTCTLTSTRDEDKGNYLNYAGPVKIPAAGHCIQISGRIVYKGKSAGAFSIGHCG
ncbi:hypothetical protein JGS39_25630 [Streptomyces sp. P01-B04]|uniref:Spore-associated protein A n=1 Tax=Streptomyces poriferorum TaxID=2798799 RepID=A0ABY9IR45_9ACTN|nr:MULTISPECIES: hypothetical protein [Streptomyces]MBW5252331.1 hypothetical protein [Streptomyces poriferorum]MBW5260081.1 hypothetical protein [Streptomyces poriferorum]MDP5313229.1 hypothetical protein [Streptomyces sp. Alt4]WLQ57782.1 hypothetical protein P8A19_21140 [Streptomyces sp. Alt2]